VYARSYENERRAYGGRDARDSYRHGYGSRGARDVGGGPTYSSRNSRAYRDDRSNARELHERANYGSREHYTDARDARSSRDARDSYSGTNNNNNSSSNNNGSYHYNSSSAASGAARDDDGARATLRTFKAFMQTQEAGVDAAEGKRRYEAYKEDFTKRATRLFFDEYKESEWFRMRYHPTHAAVRRARVAQAALVDATAFARQLALGELHWRLDVDDARNQIFHAFLEPINAGVRTSSELARGAARAATAGDASSVPRPAAVQRALDDYDEYEDAGGVSASDEAAMELALTAVHAAVTRDVERRSVFVNAVPVRATLAALEGVFRGVPGFERITLAEPQVHRRMFRRAWVTYATPAHAERAVVQLADAALELGSGKFRLQLSVNRPRRLRVPLAAPAASLPDRVAADLVRATRLVELLDREKRLWPAPSAADVTADAVVEPAGAASAAAAVPVASGDTAASGDAATTTTTTTTTTAKEGGAESVARLTAHPVFDWSGFGALPSDERLDLLVTYLRRVHHFCYYSADEAERADELERRHGPIFLRFGTQKALSSVTPAAVKVNARACVLRGCVHFTLLQAPEEGETQPADQSIKIADIVVEQDHDSDDGDSAKQRGVQIDGVPVEDR
jgi:hypothetical protein